MVDRVGRYRGCLALQFGADSSMKQEIREMLGERCGFAVVPEDEWHMTLVTKEELRGLSTEAVQEAQTLPSRCFVVGLGGGHGASKNLRDGGVYFAVCMWPKAQAFRVKFGLPLKDFHVTVSTANRHDIGKTSDALLDDSCLQKVGRNVLEALSRQVLLESKPIRAMEIATLLCTKFGRETTRGWVRLGDAALQADRPKLAMLSYAHLIEKMAGFNVESGKPGQDSPLWKHCCAQLSPCAASTEWGPIFADIEIEQVPHALRIVLCRPWSISTWVAIRDTVSNSSMSLLLLLPPRTKFTIFSSPNPASGIYSLPRFFRWIVPFQLAGVSTPRNRDDIRCFCYSLHIRHVVTLTKEEPLPPDWFEGLPDIKNTLLPVDNYHAPSSEQIDLFMRLCCSTSPTKAPVLVHCGGGKGRAGTMLACYLVAFGFRPPHIEFEEDDFQPAMTAAEAIQALRAMRPGSIETKEQEEAVSKYCSLLWKRRSVFLKEPPELAPSRPEITGKPIETSDLLVLCGLPGSGKSSFRKALTKRCIGALATRKTARANNVRYLPWTVIHSDEVGRKGCERSIGQTGTRRAVLDRCNGIRADRELFLRLASTWSQHATAVVFDTPKELCEARAMRRADHPTLPPGRRVGYAIHHHSSTFESPELSEGFQTIVWITSIEAALELVDLLSPPLPLLRFIRTPHLINLGAATEDDEIVSTDVWSLPPTQGTNIVITEKMDGANMGISLSADGAFVVQNRSHVINAQTHRQFRSLDAFLSSHGAQLYAMLNRDPLFPGRFILYGEWVAATHSIAYSGLKSLFYAFDLYDRETDHFYDRSSLQELLSVSAASCPDENPIQLVPKLYEGNILPSRDDLIGMTQHASKFYAGPIEGIYIKWEQNNRVKERSKIVRCDFISGNEHWSASTLHFNQIDKAF